MHVVYRVVNNVKSTKPALKKKYEALAPFLYTTLLPESYTPLYKSLVNELGAIVIWERLFPVKWTKNNLKIESFASII